MNYEEKTEEEVCELLVDNHEEDIANALLDAVWTMRWTENKKAMFSVLSVKEANVICLDVFKELDKAGYKIVKK